MHKCQNHHPVWLHHCVVGHRVSITKFSGAANSAHRPEIGNWATTHKPNPKANREGSKPVHFANKTYYATGVQPAGRTPGTWVRIMAWRHKQKQKVAKRAWRIAHDGCQNRLHSEKETVSTVKLRLTCCIQEPLQVLITLNLQQLAMMLSKITSRQQGHLGAMAHRNTIAPLRTNDCP